jgi:hypothetical protein
MRHDEVKNICYEKVIQEDIWVNFSKRATKKLDNNTLKNID